MSNRRFWLASLSGLIIIGLLILGGYALYTTAWSQGYALGQLAAGREGQAVAPYMPFGFGFPGPLLTLLLLLVLFVVIGKFLRLLIWAIVGGPWMMAGGPWNMANGPKGQHWAYHWHRHHGPMPPWWQGWEKPSEEQTQEAEPDTGVGDTQAGS
jgi:hypothetical protein